ncbi:MAG: two-component system LytT family sensor kinase [Sphingobacteriales bacterium]|jgi:two-component system LytT family sensor kinase
MKSRLFKVRVEYIVVQVVGWAMYSGLLILYSFFNGQPPREVIYPAIIIGVTGFIVSHIIRGFILWNGWLQSDVASLAWKLFSLGLVSGVIFWLIQRFLSIALLGDDFFVSDTLETIMVISNWSFLLLFWSIGYFGINYFYYFRRQRIAHLELVARRNENELMHWRSQMNPHFMFNALNSIRALIDEDPVKARSSVTQLASLLRNSLQFGKKAEISLDQEMEIVVNYLKLEKTRFEERLNFSLEITPGTGNIQIPPLIIQTLVENAIKHGIGQLPDGGEVIIKSVDHKHYVHILVENTGTYTPTEKDSEETGIGLENSHRRLALLYGKFARLRIGATSNGTVMARLVIPKNFKKDENLDY